MKVNNISLCPQEQYKRLNIEISNPIKNTFPKDTVDVSSNNLMNHPKRSLDGRQVNFTYSIADKKVSAKILTSETKDIQIKNENLPKELTEIKTPETFNAYFKNTFVKISHLSDGADKVSIHHKLLGGGDDEDDFADAVQNMLLKGEKLSRSKREEAVSKTVDKLHENGQIHANPSDVKSSIIGLIGDFIAGVFKSLADAVVSVGKSIKNFFTSNCTIF